MPTNPYEPPQELESQSEQQTSDGGARGYLLDLLVGLLLLAMMGVTALFLK